MYILFASIKSIGLNGLDGYIVNVESSILPGLESYQIVGLPDTAVREAKERVLSSIKTSGFNLPYGRIIINLSPANTKKEGSIFDFPMAISLLCAMGIINSNLTDDYAFLGELSLDGTINSIPGILAMTIEAKKANIKKLIVPEANIQEASIVKGIEIYSAKNIAEIIEHFAANKPLNTIDIDTNNLFDDNSNYTVDFSEVKGHDSIKRALEIAAAGSHNVLMLGNPGSGKTMLARRIPTILPKLTFEESLEITKIYSISGLLPPNTQLITNRPFRSPHHTVSSVSLIGGGRIPKPGEVSLSHYGILFLDELPEFSKNVLEVLRQPLEDRQVSISRVNASFTYPSNFMFVASMNPCPCGYLGSPDTECRCTPTQIQKYIGKISGPLLDRIDIQLEVSNIKYKDLEDCKPSEKSEVIRQRVNKAREIQIQRYKNYSIFSNSELKPFMMEKFCKLDDSSKSLLKNAFERLKLSARAYDRILKLARTIADLDGSDNIQTNHIAEAIQYRSLDKKIGNASFG